jgi:hypothetical protein
MKTWNKKLLWPFVVVALALAASQPAFAIADDDDDDDNKPPTERVPDGGATVVLLAGALIGAEALRRKLKRS